MRRFVVILFCLTTLGLQGQNWVSGKKAERWSEVEYLDLSKMRFGKTGMPDSLWTMTQLKGLRLSKNKLVFLDADIKKLTNLRVLDLSQNKLNVLTGEIGALTKLDTLILNRNGLYVLPSEMGKLESLVYLDLWSNHIDDLPESMESLSRLRKVDFSGIIVFPEQQEKLHRRFPEVELKFNKSCNCH